MNIKFLIFVFLFFYSNYFISQKFSVGEKVWAFENDDALWYEATILKVEDVLHYQIHWEGFSSNFDESIHVENIWKYGIPYLEGDKIQGLETDGKWYNVKILKRDLTSNKYFIHWGGFDSKYDRWIHYDSLRLQTKENKIEEGKFTYEVPQNECGTRTIRVVNECSTPVYVFIPPASGSGTYTHEAIAGKNTKNYFISKGQKVFLSNEKRQEVSLLFVGCESNTDKIIICK